MAPMIIGSWPGDDYQGNRFIGGFLDMLRATGAEVRSFATPGEIDFDGLDVFILHWPEKFLHGGDRLRRIRDTIGAFRGRGRCRILWVVHDLDPVQPRLNRRLVWPVARRAFARISAGYLTLSPATLPVVRQAFPGLAGKPGAAIWHPPYPDARLDAAARAAARAAHGIAPGETVIGYAGILQLYKGMGDLIDAFAGTRAPGLRLYLAGRPPRPEERPRIEAAAAADPRIILDFGHKTDTEFRAAMNVIDKFAAPMRDYLHSGSLVHALSAGAEVLTTATPFSTALEAELGRGWLTTHTAPLTPAMLERFAAAPRPGATPDLGFMAPAANLAALAALLDEVAGRAVPYRTSRTARLPGPAGPALPRGS